MVVSIKNWVELREAPGEQNSELSFVHYNHIKRVSMVEASGGEFHVLVHALNQKFLHSTHETQREAESTLVAFVSVLDV